MQMSENVSYFFKTFDFEFLNSVGGHPRLSMKNAVQIVDILAKLYMNDLILARGAGAPMMTLIHRFIDTESMIEFLPKFAKIALNAVLSFKRAIHRKGAKGINTPGGKKGKMDIVDTRKIAEAHMKLVVLLLQKIMDLHNEEINNQILTLIAAAQNRIRTHFSHDEPLLTGLLCIMGDPDQIMTDYIRSVPAEELYDEDKLKVKSAVGSGRHKRTIYIYIYIYIFVERASMEMGDEERPISGSSDRSVISDKEGVATTHKMHDESMKAYPERYQLIPYRAVNRIEQKALIEIDKIKQRKLEKLHQQELENDAKQLKDIKAKKILKAQLERRKIELGIGSRVILYIYIYIY